MQHGRQVPLVLFRDRYCGWGLRPLVDVEAGEVVATYRGEVRGIAELLERNKSLSQIVRRPSNDNPYLFPHPVTGTAATLTAAAVIPATITPATITAAVVTPATGIAATGIMAAGIEATGTADT